jgi:hypothetical protein
MQKCAIIGCWNNAPNRSGLCTEHRVESPLERAKRSHRPMEDIDRIVGIERERKATPSC